MREPFDDGQPYAIYDSKGKRHTLNCANAEEAVVSKKAKYKGPFADQFEAEFQKRFLSEVERRAGASVADMRAFIEKFYFGRDDRRLDDEQAWTWLRHILGEPK